MQSESSTAAGRHVSELSFLRGSARTALDPPTAEKLRRLAGEQLDWPYVIRAAAGHKVLPLLYQNIRDLDGVTVPGGLMKRMQQAFHQWGVLVHIRVSELTSIVRAAAAEGISVLPFKGPVLGAYAYGDAALRKPGDLDLLVRKRDFARVRRLLVEEGYEPKIPPDEERAFLEKRQGFPFYGRRCNVDLHWTLEQPAYDNFPLSFRVSPAEVWSASRPVQLDGTTVSTLSDEHLLLYLCAHGAKHSWAQLYLVCDVAELIRRHDIDWPGVLSMAREQRMERLLLVGLLLATDLLDAPLPDEIEDLLADRAPVEKLAGRFRERLSGAASGGGTLDHTITRLQLLDSPGDRISYLWSRGLRMLFYKYH